MIDIAKKKMPQPVVLLLLYVSYCATNWFSTRGTLAYYAESYGMPNWFANDIWAFFIGGIVSLVLYAFISRSAKRALSFKIGAAAKSLAYGVDLTVIAANLVLFALKFMYIAVPLAAPIIEIMINPVVTIIFVALYLVYAFHAGYIAKSSFGIVASQIMGTFLTVYGVLALANLITAVIV